MITYFDEWVQERLESHTFWIAILSNGEQVYQDDERYDEPAWVRLKQYCEENNTHIQKLLIKFRSHTELVYTDEDNEGIFLRRSVLGSLFSTRNSHFFIIGKVRGDKIYTDKWLVPEIIKDEHESGIREVSENKESIIWNTTTS